MGLWKEHYRYFGIASWLLECQCVTVSMCMCVCLCMFVCVCVCVSQWFKVGGSNPTGD